MKLKCVLKILKCIALRRIDYEKVRQFVASGEGKQIQDEIRNIVNKNTGN
jgi:CHASE3 domain sensor protein